MFYAVNPGTLFNIGIAFWLVYGILHGLISVIIWNGIALVPGCGIFYAKINWAAELSNVEILP